MNRLRLLYRLRLFAWIVGLMAVADIAATYYFAEFAWENAQPDRVVATSTVAVAGATLFLALVTLALALLAFYEIQEARRENQAIIEISQKQIEQAQRQHLESQDAIKDQITQARNQHEDTQAAAFLPLIVPVNAVSPYSNLWTAGGRTLRVSNVGPGVAINLRGLLLPPIADLNDDNAHHKFNLLYVLPLASGESANTNLEPGGTSLLATDDVQGTTLGPADDSGGTIARLTLTYFDIFGLKHASFYNLIPFDQNIAIWVSYELKRNIAYDLRELGLAKDRALEAIHEGR